MTDQPPLLLFPAPGVARIELARPDKANRLDLDDLALLGSHLAAAEADPSVSVLVLAAQGRIFSAGFDLSSVGRERGEGPDGGNRFESFANRLETTRLVTLAAINGPVIGGSTDLALACDLRLGSAGASMMMPAARYGIPLYAGALERYVSRLGVNQAKRLVFLGETIPAAEMLATGFLAEIVAEDALEARAASLAATLAALPAGPLAAMKQALTAAAARPVPAELRAALVAAYDAEAIRARIAAARPKRS